ncbi:hypothetical protein C440_14724 [Haloferax mucosum ATCC BAA-1512]|uniref:Transmembrane protein n=1 Tax=Haloferax mucosum ATCC BAA-1512 TaxID=662479 RepID=M0I6G1_9EURY|nr:hypothetical protein [Haloferax mucosum]ELZ91577.1 hypothetical protein C440_14724 [Haloferax mucosum ATCC BAA-1512]
MSWKAIDALDDARDATASLLLPFDAERWARLAFIAFFVGGFGSGGGGGAGNTGTSVPSGTGDVPVDSLPEFVTPENVFIATVGLLAVIVLLVLGFFFVGSVMQFVLVDGVVSKDIRIRKPFRERLGLGLRVFVFKAGLVLAVVLVLTLPVLALLFGGTPVGGLVLVVIPLIFLAIPVLLLLSAVLQLTTDFVVPTMIAEDRYVLSSVRRVLSVFRSELAEFGLYVVVRLFLGFAASIAVGIAALLLLFVAAIPFVIVGGGLAIAFSAAGVPLFSLAGGVVFGIIGVLFLLTTFAVSALVQMPVVTFFRYYSLFLLGSVDESLDLVSSFRTDDDSPAPEGPTPA